MKRAYRRPVSDAEIDIKLALYDLVRKDSPSFVEAIKTPLSAVLVSPHFLYLAEPENDATLAALPTPKKVPGEAALARLAAVSPRFQQSGDSPTATADSGKTPARLSNSFRRYRDSSGRQMTGRLISFNGVTVRMEMSGGRIFGIPLAKFSSTDRAYIRALAAKAKTATPKPAPNSATPKPATPVRPTSPGSPPAIATLSPSGSAPRRLTSYELASRLSYFLWSSMPDDELFNLADQDRLTDPETLAGQVDRMLSDPKSNAFVKNFAGQ